MEKKNKNCQSCGMPLSKDPQGGGTEKDGSKSLKYCHWCYKDGEFVGGNVSFEEWREMAIKGMTENGDMSKFMAWLFTRKMFLKNLERWKSKQTGENMIKKSILIWLSIIPLAILNGGLREAFLVQRLEESCAQIVSGLLLLLLIFAVTLIFIPRIGKGKQKTYWVIGLLWVALTVIFETVFGFAMGNSFGALLKAYDITTGNLWLIIVVFIGFAPWLTAKIRRII